MFADQLRASIEAAPRGALTKISALLWKSLRSRAGQRGRGGGAVGGHRGQAGAPAPAEARPAPSRLAATITCLDGKTPPLGRRRGSAAAARQPVHAGRAGRPGRDRRRARQAGAAARSSSITSRRWPAFRGPPSSAA